MNKSNEAKIIKLFFCLAIAVLGIYMTFFNNDGNKNEAQKYENDVIEENQEAEMIFEQAQDPNNLPEYENESSSELVSEGMVEKVYFTNTSVIDEGKLPVEVHSVLVSDAQKYLNRSGYEDVTELYIDEESYIEEDNFIAFNCYMDGYSEELRIVFERTEGNLKFSIVEK